MKYLIINETNPCFKTVFEGSEIFIGDEKRLWDNDSVGRSYPEKDCIELWETF